MDSREVLRRLHAAGWRAVRQRGSHVQLRRDDSPNVVTVPPPTRDMAIGTLKSIQARSGVNLTGK